MIDRRLLIFVGLAALLVGWILLRSSNDPQDPVGEALAPDLWTSEPIELTVEDLDGRTVLRFTTAINNQGAGDLILRGNPNSSEIDQWIEHSESGHAALPLDVSVVWGGDTHEHWHIDAVARYWIEAIDGADIGDRFDNKVGFCIFDSLDFQSGLPGAPNTVRYEVAGCGNRLDPEIAMGLSVGWGDRYRFDLAGQYIDIEDLGPGTYRLMAEVDPDELLHESDRTNNTAFTEFTLELEPGQPPAVQTRS